MSIADWYVVGIGVTTVVVLICRLVWALSDPFAWSSWRESWRKHPPADPEIRGTPAPRFGSPTLEPRETDPLRRSRPNPSRPVGCVRVPEERH